MSEADSRASRAPRRRTLLTLLAVLPFFWACGGARSPGDARSDTEAARAMVDAGEDEIREHAERIVALHEKDPEAAERAIAAMAATAAEASRENPGAARALNATLAAFSRLPWHRQPGHPDPERLRPYSAPIAEGETIAAAAPNDSLTITAGAEFVRIARRGACEWRFHLVPILENESRADTFSVRLVHRGIDGALDPCGPVRRIDAEERHIAFRSEKDALDWVRNLDGYEFHAKSGDLLIAWREDSPTLKIGVWKLHITPKNR